jgi:hypothetical protein
MATDNGLEPVRELLQGALDGLENANEDWDPEHPYYEKMKAIKDWLEHPDNPPVHLQTGENLKVPLTVQDKFEFITKLMTDFKDMTWPKDMVMLKDLEEAIEAWQRFQIAWFG